MKNLPCLLLTLIAPTVFAQPAMPVKQGVPHVEFVTIDQLPVPVPPSELQKAKLASTAKADDGYSTLENAPHVVRQFLTNIEIVTSQVRSPASSSFKAGRAIPRAPDVVRELSDLKLSFKTVALARGELIGATPRGTIIGDAWTGIDRFYRISGAGIMRLSETDMKASGGKFFMLKDAINTQVAGQPAISKVFIDGDGQTVEEVLWVNEHKLYTLTFAPEVKKGKFGKAKSNIQVSATSLAQELR